MGRSLEEKDAWIHQKLDTVNNETLLMRMGGLPALTDFVYGFYDNMLKDSQLGQMLKKWMQTAPHEVYMKHLKDRTVDYLEVVWDNDDWTGQDLFVAHAHLHISGDFFDRALKCAKSKVNSMGLPSSVRADIMKEMNIMKEPITDPGGKFQKWIVAKQEMLEAKSRSAVDNGDVIVTEMGFTVTKAELEAMAEKARKAEERKRLMAEQKRKREQQETEVATRGEKQLEDKVAKTKAPTKNDEARTNPSLLAKPKAKAAGKAASDKLSSQEKTGVMNSHKRKAESADKAKPDVSPEMPPEDGRPCVPESRSCIGFLVTAH